MIDLSNFTHRVSSRRDSQLNFTDEEKNMLEKWQIFGLYFINMSKTPEYSIDLVNQEFGFIWDSKGWIKEVSYQ